MYKSRLKINFTGSNAFIIKILLIENNRFLSNVIAEMFNDQKNIKIIASIGTGEYTVVNQKLKPNVILLDLGVINDNSFNDIETAKNYFPKAKVILINFENDVGILNLFKYAGVSGFIYKEATIIDYIETICFVVKSFNEIINENTELIRDDIIEIKNRNTKLIEFRMTEREQEVIDLISEGLSNKEIGHNMHISTFTVKSHIHNIMEKLEMHTRLEVANYSFKS